MQMEFQQPGERNPNLTKQREAIANRIKVEHSKGDLRGSGEHVCFPIKREVRK